MNATKFGDNRKLLGKIRGIRVAAATSGGAMESA